MITTEEQAKKKRCPFARVALPAGHAGNRISSFHKNAAAKSSTRDAEWYEQQEADCKCFGSGCMAWRAAAGTTDEGFCGLAGSAS